MVGNTTWGQHLDGYDLTFVAAEEDALGQGDDLGVMLARDKDAILWQGEHDPALESENFRPRPVSYLWKNGGEGAGHSQRTPATTTTSLGGALTSLAYSYAPWCTSIIPGVLMPSGALSTLTTPGLVTTGTIVDGLSYDGNYYLTTSGRYLIKIASEDGATSSIDMGASYTCVGLTVFKDYLWISGQGSGTIRRYDGTTLTNGGVDTERSRLAVTNWTISPQIATGGATDTGGTNSARMIGTNPAGTTFQHIAEADDPLDDADWSGDIKIGDGTSYTTQWIVGNNHTVWFATTGGIIACDETGYTPNITEWVKQHYSANNGGQVIYMNGLIWYAHDSGLVVVPVTGERQDLAERWAQFGYLVPNQAPIYGRPRALAPGGDCIWVGYVNTTSGTSYVMRLIIEKDGSTRWSGPEAVFANETISLIRRVSPASGSPYLLIATQVAGGASAPKIYRQELPRSGNPYVDWINGTGYTFATSSSVYLPREDFDSASRKVAERYAIVCKNLGGGREAAIYANVDDLGYVHQGTAKRSPRRTFLAAETTTSGVQWNWRIDLTGTASTPWILESFGVGAAIVPDRQTVRSYRILIAERESLRNGTEEMRDPQAVWKRIEALQHRDRVELRDQFGETLTVRILQSIPHQVYWDERRSSWVMVCTISVRVISEPARFRTGYCYNANAYYGSAS